MGFVREDLLFLETLEAAGAVKKLSLTLGAGGPWVVCSWLKISFSSLSCRHRWSMSGEQLLGQISWKLFFFLVRFIEA